LLAYSPPLAGGNDAMKRWRWIFQDIFADERGATMVDYTVLLMILTLTLIATVSEMSNALISFFQHTASAFGSF
jgi:Flp pilus assembly pilin Flp